MKEAEGLIETHVGDCARRTILDQKIVEEKAHVDWLETQREAIGRIGAERYLSRQLRDGDG